jgi:hypothetical protein
MKFGGTPFVKGVACKAKLILEQMVLERMAGPAQFLVTQSIQLLTSAWGKDFFPAKDFLSLDSTLLGRWSSAAHDGRPYRTGSRPEPALPVNISSWH